MSREFVALLGHGNTDHETGEYVYDGEKKKMCGIYDLPSCAAHEAMRNVLSQKGLLKDVRGTPTHIFYNPNDLTEISRSHHMTLSQIEDACAEAQKVLGKPISWREYSKIRKDLEEAVDLSKEGDYRKALRALDDFDAGGLKSLEAQAKTLHEEILAAGRKQIDEAQALLEAGESSKALKIGREVLREFKGTDLEEAAKELIAAAKAD